jgi:hypothetical protein
MAFPDGILVKSGGAARHFEVPAKRVNMLAPCPFKPGSVEFNALEVIRQGGGKVYVSVLVGKLWWTRSKGSIHEKLILPLERAGLVVVDSRLIVLTESGYAALGDPESEVCMCGQESVLPVDGGDYAL